jgi:hypothetical protein
MNPEEKKPSLGSSIVAIITLGLAGYLIYQSIALFNL